MGGIDRGRYIEDELALNIYKGTLIIRILPECVLVSVYASQTRQ